MHRYDRPRRLLAFAIAALAGFVDATGYLAADRYFVSFMSGNTTRLGVDLATSPGASWIPALLIAGFMASVLLGALLADVAGTFRKTAVIGASCALLCAAALAQMAGAPALFIGCAVLAMGVLNNCFRSQGEVAVGLTYMTGAIVRFSQGLAAWLRGTPNEGWTAYLALWISLAAGAACGALAAIRDPVLASWTAAGVALALVTAAWQIERRGARRPG